MIQIRTAAQIDRMRASCRLTAQCMAVVAAMVQPGVTTAELDRAADDFIRSRGGVPSFKGYGGYPAAICTSVNDVVVHGFPDERPLQKGDIVSVDLGAYLDGYTGDMARTFTVGEVSEEARRLIDVTQRCFFAALNVIRPGARVGDIGFAVQSLAEGEGFSVVRDLCGHGVGEALHEEPEVPNFGRPGRGVRLEKGMTIAVEPMINEGTWRVTMNRGDAWNVRTADGKLSAHYEETIAVTETGAEILTVP